MKLATQLRSPFPIDAPWFWTLPNYATCRSSAPLTQPKGLQTSPRSLGTFVSCGKCADDAQAPGNLNATYGCQEPGSGTGRRQEAGQSPVQPVVQWRGGVPEQKGPGAAGARWSERRREEVVSLCPA